ncbi:unnamed protein product [marine sediment metagenome]|uniref:Uncharacterized protein n=1 Tax=marine sediment metagenome TaxID=412755 RepID=X0VLT4_9ZZZZ
MKKIEDKIDERFFADYDNERAIISGGLSCQNLAAFSELTKKYGESKVLELLCTDLKTNVNPTMVFDHLKNAPLAIDFI